MGASRSKSQEPEPSTIIDSSSKELDNQHEMLQEKLDTVASDFTDTSKIGKKVSSILASLEEGQQILNGLIADQKAVRGQYEQFARRTQELQSEIFKQASFTHDVNDHFMMKIEGYEKTNNCIEHEIDSLSKQLKDNNNILKIFKLSRMSHANGIHKAQKEGPKCIQHGIKRHVLTPLAESRLKFHAKGSSYSDRAQIDEIENQPKDVLSFVVEESPQRSTTVAERSAQKDQKCLEPLNFNIANQ